MRSVLAQYEYTVVRPPRVFRNNPSSELKVSFSLVLADFLRRAPEVTFVQVGGFDGQSNDPLFSHVTSLHWKGLVVEPQPDAFASLASAYAGEPQVALENVAVAAKEGTETLWRIRRGVLGLPEWAPQLASFDREVVLRHKAQIPNIEDLIEPWPVPCRTLTSLLTKHELHRVDVLQIDVEGFDYEVIKLIDFERWKPAIVRYEHAHLSEDDAEACLELLAGQGYRLAVERRDTIAYRSPDPC